MKKLTTTTIITMIATLLLTAAGTTFAKGPGGESGKKGQRHNRSAQAMPAVDQLMRGIRRLDLNAAQEESVKAVMQGMKEETRPIMRETKALHMQLKDLVKADVYDAEAVAAIAEQEGDLAAERIMISSKAISEVFSQLTDEQREQLETMAQEHKERVAERRERRAEAG